MASGSTLRCGVTGQTLYQVWDTDRSTGRRRCVSLMTAFGLSDARRKAARCYGSEVTENPSHHVEIRALTFKTKSVEFGANRDPDD